MRNPVIRLAAVSAAALGCAVCADRSFAQDWKLSSSLSEKGFYDDNLLLNPNNQLSTFGSTTTPTLSIVRKSPTSKVDLTGRFPYTAYFSHEDLNRADQFVNLDAEEALSERSSISFSGDFQHDSTLESQQDVSDQFLNKQVPFIRFDATPAWTYLLGPIDQVTFSGTYTNVNYHANDKTDYQYFGPDVAYQRSLSELSAITGSLSYKRFEPDDLANTRTDVYGGLIGYSYTPSERLSVSGSVGLSYNVTHSDFAKEDDSLGYRAKFDLDYDISEQTSLLFSLSHDSEPSGDGRQVTRNRARLGFKYRLDELTTFGLDGNYTDNEDYFGTQTGTNENQKASHYFSVAPSVSFQLTEDLSLVAQYRFRHKMLESGGGSATSNSAFLLLQYDLPTLGWGGD